jgi:predicted lipoprotein with Yx(FWY)xxD motif
MKYKLMIAGFLNIVLLVTACAPVSGETRTPADTPVIPETGGTATESMAETETPTIEAGTETPALMGTQVVAETPGLAAGSDVTVMVSNEGTSPFLVDDQGRSLYVYMTDSQNSSTSACIDDCAVEWPPLTVTGVPAAGTGIDASLLGTLSRDDGSTQASYTGWPLYYYNMDTIPGTTNGHNYNGVWFLISPTGEPIQQ